MREKLIEIILFALVFLVIGIFIGISFTSLAPPITTTTTTTTANNTVCCHSFGFGSEMKRCCDKYDWTTADECKVPEGLVGGGKEIVDNSYCVAATTTTTTTTIRVCPTIMACLYNPTSKNYEMFTGCNYTDAKSSGWIETNFSNPNYCNIDDDCTCSLIKCFRGNKYYANCVQDVNACQMSYCPFTSEQRMVCINHVCQIETI